MTVRVSMILALALVGGDAAAQNPPATRKDPTAELLAKLRKPVDPVVGGATVSLAELAELIGAKSGVAVLVNEAAFKVIGAPNPADLMVKVPQVRGMALNVVLAHALTPLDATFLVRKDHVEILPIALAAKETKNLASAEDDGPARMNQALVSMIFKEKPLNEAVAELAEEYDLTVVVAPQAADARMGFITARLLNVPADKALELLAIQCDLRVIHKGNAFLLTSRDHANDLFNEQVERERTKIEIEKLRTSPIAPPKPELPPQPQPNPQPNVIPPPKPAEAGK